MWWDADVSKISTALLHEILLYSLPQYTPSYNRHAAMLQVTFSMCCGHIQTSVSPRLTAHKAMMAIILTIIAPAVATIIGQYSKLVVGTTGFSTKVSCSSGSKGKQHIVQATLKRARQLHLRCNENF